MLHQAFKRSEYLRDVPCFGIDPSYGHEDKDFEYVARQLKDELAPSLKRPRAPSTTSGACAKWLKKPTSSTASGEKSNISLHITFET